MRKVVPPPLEQVISNASWLQKTQVVRMVQATCSLQLTASCSRPFNFSFLLNIFLVVASAALSLDWSSPSLIKAPADGCKFPWIVGVSQRSCKLLGYLMLSMSQLQISVGFVRHLASDREEVKSNGDPSGQHSKVVRQV